ncbi:MAG: transporter [Geminicoccaceae bacterium]
MIAAGLATLGMVPVAVVQASLPPVVTVRAGQHEDYRRIVFDWPSAVAHQVAVQDGALLVRFDRPARFETDPARAIVRDADGMDGALDSGASAIRLSVGAPAVLRSFQLNDHRVVIDLAPDAEAAHAAARATPPPVAMDAADLRAELYRRDQMIASLLRRVERLERDAVGIEEIADLPLQAQPVPQAMASIEPSAGADTAAQASDAERPAARAALPEELERALERTLSRAGVLLLPTGFIEIEPSLSYTRRENDIPILISGGGGLIAAGEEQFTRDEFGAALAARVGLPFDSQFEIRLPFTAVSEESETRMNQEALRVSDAQGQGLGDIRLGLAKTFLREGVWRPDLVGRVYWDTASGERFDNDVALGSGFDEVGVSLSAVKRQDPLAFVGALGYETAFESDDIQPGDSLFFSLATVLAATPQTSLRVAFTQQFDQETEVNGQSIAGSDASQATLTLGGATILGRGALLDLALDIGLSNDAPAYALRASVPIRFQVPRYASLQAADEG